MDRTDELLEKYGLVPETEYLEVIRKLLIDEIENNNSEDNEYLKTLCIKLFSLGNVEDTYLIWRAKNKNFDTGCYIDIQLLCGAGIEETKKYLSNDLSNDAFDELSYIENGVISGDFNDFSRAKIIKFYKEYYGIE
ncbi:hypothetical protein [Paenibacillus sedimenti]|uniref:Uncharacterized protein n=1 Tax=Paenibacillus sedimenti TaxID=2770274 RepID=A0A926KLT7_9BACL|nr:hypothetical protein [Paenibacillus sedimenti]MBD0380177.1 hypothetical protein [Paenibacillus sedimenti]